MVHSKSLPTMVDIDENAAYQNHHRMAHPIASFPATIDCTQARPAALLPNHTAPLTGRVEQQPTIPIRNTFTSQAPQPNIRHPLGWPVPSLFNVHDVAHQPTPPSICHINTAGTGLFPPPPPRGWAAAPSGGAAAAAVAMKPSYGESRQAAVRQGGGPARLAPVPDKSFEEFLVEHGVLGPPRPPPSPTPRDETRGVLAGGGIVGSSRTLPECNGVVIGGDARNDRHMVSVVGRGARPCDEQVGRGAVCTSEASGGERSEEARERPNHTAPLTGRAEQEPNIPIRNTFTSSAPQPTIRHPLGWPAPPHFMIHHVAHQPTLPSICHVNADGTGPFPPQPRGWDTASSGVGAAAAMRPTYSESRRTETRQGGGPVRARLASVPDKSFEEFLVERGVLGPPCPPPPPIPHDETRGVLAGGGIVRSGRSLPKCNGVVIGGGAQNGGRMVSVVGHGARPCGELVGRGTVCTSEAPGGEGAEEARQRRRMRMCKTRETAAKARAQKLAAARAIPDGNQEQSEPSGS